MAASPPGSVDAWISRLAGGRDFIDVGALWKTRGEKVTVAAKAGAKTVTALDCVPEENAAWSTLRMRFEQHRQGYPASGIQLETMVADACTFSSKKYGVIHCNGVLYHLSDPSSLILNLRRACSDDGWLILGTVFLSDPVCKQLGISPRIPVSLYIPGLVEPVKELIVDKMKLRGFSAIGLTQGWPRPWDIKSYGPYWTVPNRAMIYGMLRSQRFKVESEFLGWDGRVLKLLCKAV